MHPRGWGGGEGLYPISPSGHTPTMTQCSAQSSSRSCAHESPRICSDAPLSQRSQAEAGILRFWKVPGRGTGRQSPDHTSARNDGQAGGWDVQECDVLSPFYTRQPAGRHYGEVAGGACSPLSGRETATGSLAGLLSLPSTPCYIKRPCVLQSLGLMGCVGFEGITGIHQENPGGAGGVASPGWPLQPVPPPWGQHYLSRWKAAISALCL